MTTLFLTLAALMAALTFLAHVVIGGRVNAAPVLSRPDLPNGPKTTMTFSWNAASLLLLAIALGYGFSALQGPANQPLVWFLTLLCVFHAALGVASSLRGGLSPLRFPPAMLFLAISAFGGLALLTA